MVDHIGKFARRQRGTAVFPLLHRVRTHKIVHIVVDRLNPYLVKPIKVHPEPGIPDADPAVGRSVEILLVQGRRHTLAERKEVFAKGIGERGQIRRIGLERYRGKQKNALTAGIDGRRNLEGGRFARIVHERLVVRAHETEKAGNRRY